MVVFAKAIAGNSDLLTAQAFVYQSLNLNLSFLITASGDDVFTKVRMTASSLESKFFEMEDAIPQRLEQLIRLVNEELSDLADVEVLLSVWQEDILYIKSQGKHQIYLFRDTELTNLTPKFSNEQSHLVSGHLKKGDKILFLSGSIDQIYQDPAKKYAVTEKLFNSVLENFGDEIESIWRSEEEAESSSSLLHSKRPIASILIDFHSDEIKNDYSGLSEPQVPQVAQRLSLHIVSQLGRFFLNFLRLSSNLLPKSKRPRLILGLILLFIIIGGVGFSTINKNKQVKNAQIDSLLGDISSKVSQAQNLKDLDVVLAEQNLNDAKKGLDSASLLSPNNPKIKDLEKKLTEITPQILKIYRVNNFQVFLSLDLIKKDFSATNTSYSLGNILLLDPDKKTLVFINLDTKSHQILAGENQLGKALYASLNGDFAFVFSEDKGVLKISTKLKKITTAFTTDSEWGEIVDIVGFGSNVYLLDILNNQIWKYTPVAAGYSNKITYFKKGRSTDLLSAERFEIDSSVWILKSNTELIKFTSGVEDNFSLSGLDKNISHINSFFIADTTDNVYIIDSANSRMVVVDKAGKYVAQYTGDKFKKASDLVVEEKKKKVYLLEGNKIYTFDLK